MWGPSGIPIKMLRALPRIFGACFQLIRHLSRQRRIFHGWFARACDSLPSCPLPHLRQPPEHKRWDSPSCGAGCRETSSIPFQASGSHGCPARGLRSWHTCAWSNQNQLVSSSSLQLCFWRAVWNWGLLPVRSAPDTSQDTSSAWTSWSFLSETQRECFLLGDHCPSLFYVLPQQ